MPTSFDLSSVPAAIQSIKKRVAELQKEEDALKQELMSNLGLSNNAKILLAAAEDGMPAQYGKIKDITLSTDGSNMRVNSVLCASNGARYRADESATTMGFYFNLNQPEHKLRAEVEDKLQVKALNQVAAKKPPPVAEKIRSSMAA